LPIQNDHKIKFEEEKISQYEAEIYQLQCKIEEIEAAKQICENRLSSMKRSFENSKGRRKPQKDPEHFEE
jgi:predicted RNase H-like nuclease (RuvC/YqgF family)